MVSKKMKFLTIKPKGGKEHPFVGGSSEEKQSQSLHSNLLGTWKSKIRGSWLCNPQAVVKQLQKILDSDDVHVITKQADLSKVHLRKVAHPRRGLIIRNPHKSYNPRKFHVLLEDVNYCFKRTNWKKYFPPFRSALEAHRNLHILLGIFYNMYHDKYKDRADQKKEDEKESPGTFVVGQLVLVKCMTEKNSDSSYSYEVRRGMVEEIDSSQCIYIVQLLDFGFRLEISGHFMCPLPRPFNCISPMAIPCSLYGVSPLGAKWSNEAIRHFSDLLESHPDSVFVVDILLNRSMHLIVNINVCNIEVMDKTGQKRRPRVKFEINLTQFMIDSKMGSQWNLFPARPKLMSEVIPSPEGHRNHKDGKLELTPTTISFQDALLMTNIYLPVLHMRLPRRVIRMEFKKLFRLRHFSQITDMKNHFVVETAKQNHHFKTPCTLKMLRTEEHCGKDQTVQEEEK